MEAIVLSLLYLLLGMFGHFLEMRAVMSHAGTVLLCQGRGGERENQEKEGWQWRLVVEGGGGGAEESKLLSHQFFSHHTVN